MARQNSLKTVVIASVIGATIEWYDFFLYGIVAGLVLNKLYFPTSNPVVSIMLAYATFAIGYTTRPLGAVIFGHFGDKLGRKAMLVLTLCIMGVGTLLIGLLPTYQQIGLWAPALLLLLRLVQGLGIGGEWGGAILMAFECAPKGKRGLYASLPQVGLSIGLLLSSGIVALMSKVLTDAQFLAWGWRIAFLVSVFLVAVGIYIRLNVLESPEFAEVKKSGSEVRVPFMELMRTSKKNVLLGMGARYLDGLFFNVLAVFAISYLTHSLKVPRTTALLGVTLSALVMNFFIPYFGHLSDRVGRAKTYFWASLLTGATAFPAFWIMETFPHSSTAIWLAFVIPFGIIYAGIYGPEAALFAELFDVRVRYTGISFVYQFSGIFAGGLTPIICEWLLHANNGKPWYICSYILVVTAITCLSAWLIGKNVQQREAERESEICPLPTTGDQTLKRVTLAE